MTVKERYARVIEWFKASRPVAETELHYENPFQLLVAVILSAQCTDKRVNLITPALFEVFPDAASMAVASPERVYELIKSCSYPNNKAKALVGMARGLIENFGGMVPDDIDSLMSLPGVGRKTANVILSVVFDRPAMAVDTHVFRVAERIGLTTRSRTPLDTEKALTAMLPEDTIAKAHHWLILHGRYVCKARKPQCGECFLTDVCRHYGSRLRSEERALERIKKTAKAGE